MTTQPPPVPSQASAESSGPMDAFRIGRPRPPHEPKRVVCPNCGSQLELQDERTRMAVCSSCNSRLFVGLAEAQVLGKIANDAGGRHFDFHLQIGDRFLRKSVRYRVVARIAFIEDGEHWDPTLQYLLYHPTRGSLWLSEYKDHWDLSWTTHVMPRRDFGGFDGAFQKGQTIETHDGRRWMVRETGTYELAYVDGALPWVAEVGDEIDYAEMDGGEGQGDTYEVERAGDEIEFARGLTLTAAQVRRASGKKSVPDAATRPDNVVQRAAAFRWAMILAALAALVNGLLALAFLFQGEYVLRQSFSAEELTNEAFSAPFQVTEDGNVLKIELSSSLSNAWMSVDLALVRDADWLAEGSLSGGSSFGAGDLEVLHVHDHDIEYYHGVEGGESWSEGNQDATAFLRVPEAGTYRLLARAVSASGNAPSAQTAQHSLHVRVKDGARRALWPFVACIASLVVMFWQVGAWNKWKQDED